MTGPNDTNFDRLTDIDISNLMQVINTGCKAPWALANRDRKDIEAAIKPENAKRLFLTTAERQIIEEVAFLCCYTPFVKDICDLRQKLAQHIRVSLPVDDARGAHIALEKIYSECRLKYWNAIKTIVTKYRLSYSLYWPNNSPFEWNELIKNECINEEGMTLVEAEKYIVQKMLNEPEWHDRKKTILDSILLLNDPYHENVWNSWRPTDYCRNVLQGVNAGFRFGHHDDYPYLEIRVPAYSSPQEIRDYIKNWYPKIRKERSRLFPQPNRRDARKGKPENMLRLYRMRESGKDIEAIAIELDKMEGRDGCDDLRKTSAIKRTLDRADEEMKLRFGKKQDT